MKKILCLLGTITLIGTSTTSLVACNTALQQYTEKELADLKEKNNIKIKDGILEWIASQEKTFNIIDDKYFFVIWRGNKELDWIIIKFQNNKNIRLSGGFFNFVENSWWNKKNHQYDNLKTNFV